MADKSNIEWTDATWTPIRARNLTTGKIGWHCEHATTGCEFCYAEGFNKRLGTGLPFKPGHRKDIDIFLDEAMLMAPLRWKKPRMIFVCSMTDAFADFVKDEWLDQMFAVMALCSQHTFQVLTKRPERMRDYNSGKDFAQARRDAIAHAIPDVAYYFARSRIPAALSAPWPLPNVWLGVSAERQQEADERIPHLLQTPAAVRFVSLEPLLGPIKIWPFPLSWKNPDGDVPSLDWVIVGGESGKNARPMNPQWPRDIRDQCKAAGVTFFHKQNGEYASVSEVEGPGALFHFPDGRTVRRVGKKAAGRTLDGRTYDAFPEVRT